MTISHPSLSMFSGRPRHPSGLVIDAEHVMVLTPCFSGSICCGPGGVRDHGRTLPAQVCRSDDERGVLKSCLVVIPPITVDDPNGSQAASFSAVPMPGHATPRFSHSTNSFLTDRVRGSFAESLTPSLIRAIQSLEHRLTPGSSMDSNDDVVQVDEEARVTDLLPI